MDIIDFSVCTFRLLTPHTHTHTTHTHAGPEDILKHNLKLILGLVWALILHYQIAGAGSSQDKEAKPEDTKTKQKRLNAKKLLLGWVNATLPVRGHVSNFTTDWNDGLRLSTLVDYCKPGLIPDHATLDPNNGLQNVTNAMDLAEENFGIPQVMHPEDLAVEKPDELSVMTYLSYFCRPDSVGQNALLGWIQEKIPSHNVTNFTSDWVDGRALGALTDVVSGGAFPESEEMSPQQGLENCQHSMDAADRILGINQTVTPNDFANLDLDQLSRTTYLTQFRHASASQSPASKLSAAGPGITGDFSGKETNFVVRGRIPNWSKLNVSVMSPSGEKIPVKQHMASAKSVSYQYTPTSPGSYTVEIKLDNEHIPRSPFSVTHSTPSSAEKCLASGPGLSRAHVGEPATFSVNCEAGGPGNLMAKISGPTGNVGTDIKELKDRDYKVKYTPLEAGPHTVSVLWDGKHVANSPFTCLVADPAKCIATGPGLTGAVVGEAQHFTVKTDQAGPGTLSAEAQGPAGPVPVQIRDEGRGNFTCTYVPKESGRHTIDVHWSDAPISGSPFKVNAVVPADASKCVVSDLPTGRLHAGKTYHFDVDTRQAGTGELKAVAHGPSIPEKCGVVRKQEGLYTVNFTPGEVGPLKVDVSFGSSPINGSPFEFTVNDPTKCKVNRVAIENGAYRVKQPIDFRVAAQYAGEGNLMATVRGEKGSEDLEVKDQGDGTYLVHYTPAAGGPHAIDINFDGEQIPDVPIRIFVEAGSSADNVVVTQPVPSKLGVYTVDHPHNYKVNAAGAGEAELTATSHGARTGLKPKLDIVDEGNNRYTVSLVAAEPDNYHVSVLWGEEHVPGSPFQLPVEDNPRPEKVECVGPHYKVGSTAPVTLEVNTENAGAGELSATCYGNKAGSVPVSIKENEPKNYTVSFVPPASSEIYSLSVLWSEENVKNSPFKVNLIPPDASKCIVTGPDIPLEQDQPVVLHVDATHAGNGTLDARAIGDSVGASDVDIKEVEPNKFDVYFYPRKPDYYNLDVTWGDKSVPGAPFRLDLSAARADEVFLAEPPTAMLEAGQAIGICFDTSKAGRGELTAVCEGNKVGEIPVKVKARRNEKDKYDVQFTPPEPDVYFVSVRWAGQHIKGSPFTINLMPVDVSKVKVIGPTMPLGPGGPIELMLQTQGAGKGKVTAACVGNKSGNVPVSIQETAQDCYQLQFNPPVSDIYSLAVQYGGHDVTGSPFRINTFPADAGKVKVTEPEKFDLSKPLHYKVDARNAGNGDLTATCRGEKYGAVQLDTTEEGIAQYDLSFTAHNPDKYKLSIQWSGKEVPGSLFKINFLPAEADKVKVTDLHIPDEAGTGEPVWVDLDCGDAGQGSLRGEAWGDLVGDISVEAERKGARKFRVKFPPKQADMYHFSVWYGDGHVPGSPFNINLVPPQPDRVKLIDTSVPLEAGAPVSLTFDTSKAGVGSLGAQAVGESVGPVPVKIEQLYPTEFKVTFIPPEPDSFKIDVTWADEPVKNSPFTINTRPEVHPELVECGEPVYTSVGEPVELAVDASKAGPGTLTATCSGDDCGRVPVEVTKTSARTYDVSFTPKQGDEYTLSVFYDGTEVQDSPFRVNMKPVQESADFALIEQVEEAMVIPEGLLESAPPDEEEERIESELTNYVGQPLTLTVDAEDEQDMKGVLVANAAGESTGPADVKVTRNPDNTFDVYFNPDKPDHYRIDVKLNDKHVPGSPFNVNYILPIDSGKCYIFGLQDIPSVPQVNEPICFGVDATSAGEGKLAVTADGPSMDGSPSKLEVKSKEEHPQVYNITYIPTAVGQHRVHLLWEDESIPGSPLTFEVGDASQLQTYPYGKLVGLDISADCKQGDLDSYAVHEDTGTRFKVKIAKQQKGKFKLSFQPKEPGIYAIHVLLKRKEIPGSPYRIRVTGPPNPMACIVSGLDREGYVGEPVTFKVDVSDAGSGDLLMKASGPTSAKESDFTVSDNQDGTYSATYIPNAAGDHQFDITWAGIPLPESPYHISISERKADIKKALQGKEVVNMVEVGQPVDICASNLGKEVDEDYITAKCSGEHSGEADVVVEKKEDGSYVVRFTPIVPDDYMLWVKLNKEDIEGSPFRIKVVEKGALAADGVHPEGPCQSDVEVGQSVNLIVRAEDVKSASELSVETEGPIGACETSISGNLEGNFGLGFVPAFPGDYIVHARKEDDNSEIAGSPFKVIAVSKSDPSKVHIMEDDMPIFQKSIPFGRPAKFSISTVDAGPGTLNITSRGPGKAEVKVFDNKDGTYTCEFTPTVAGKYHVDVLWNDQHISSSPFTLNFKSKKSRIITGLNLEDESFRLNVPHRFKLHCGEVGEGVLEITCKPPSAGKIKLTPLGTPNSYQCEILPIEVGNNEISVQFNGKHILGSPFNVVFELRGDASKCRMVESSVEHQQEVGDNVSFCISTEGAGKGKLTASVENADSKEQLPVSITQSTEVLYNIDFNPGDGAEYLLTVKYDDQHILGSPFKLVFGPPASNASKCYAEGDGLISCVVDKWSKFVVDITDAGPGDLKVTIDGTETIDPTVSTISENQLEVAYLPPKAGTYKISVLWADSPVPESPFEVTCYNPADPSLFTIFDPISETFLGKPVEFIVTAEGASTDGTLTVIAQSSKNKNVPGTAELRDDGNFVCNVSVPDLGRYMMHVRWNGAHIKGSPFKMKVMNPPRPDRVRSYGPGLDNGFVGQEGNFTVETGDGGAGTLSVRVHGPKGAFKINMRRHPENERTILVRYDPNIAGVYTVDITWSETHIPGSPFSVNIEEHGETGKKGPEEEA